MAANSAVRSIYEASAKEGLISDVLVVRTAVLAEKGAAIRALIKSWGQAVDFYNSNLSQGRAIIARGVGEDPAALTTAFDGVHFFDLAQNQAEFSGEYVNSTLPAIQNAARAAGLLAGSTSPAAAIDASYLP
jgi:NitT/TauT family transport system substrate-binding protein